MANAAITEVRPAVSPPQAAVSFAHPSEELFAQMMDFYGIDWQYEPRTFPVEWDGAGNVVEAFKPDFYLPEMDLYVELTFMKQSLVRHKNRKLKRMKELYPEVNVRVFYQKDIEDLIFKLGGQNQRDSARPQAGASRRLL